LSKVDEWRYNHDDILFPWCVLASRSTEMLSGIMMIIVISINLTLLF
jgi:hypothetical protein